jgi:hypothetical protein
MTIYWLPYTCGAIGLSACSLWLLRHSSLMGSSDLDNWIQDAKESVVGFWDEHVERPVRYFLYICFIKIKLCNGDRAFFLLVTYTRYHVRSCRKLLFVLPLPDIVCQNRNTNNWKEKHAVLCITPVTIFLWYLHIVQSEFMYAKMNLI